jgi:hypothetical protein
VAFAATEADIKAAKAKTYVLGGESFPSIYGVLGERELVATQSGEEGGVPYFLCLYKTRTIENDLKGYIAKLQSENWIATKVELENDFSSGVVTMMNESREAGKLLIITIECLEGVAYKLNMAKMEGTLTRN